jgi:hypothetical protein
LSWWRGERRVCGGVLGAEAWRHQGILMHVRAILCGPL